MAFDFFTSEEGGATLFCTLGVAVEGSDGATYFATAGHCGRRSAEGAPATVLVDGERVGDFVWFEEEVVDTAHRETALIRLLPGVPSSADVLGLGVPRGILDVPPPGDTRLVFTGQGIPEAATRPGYAMFESHQPSEGEAHLPVWFGDSGSTVFTCDGMIIGTVHTFGARVHNQPTITHPIPGEPPSYGQMASIPMLDEALDRAGEALGVDLEPVLAADAWAPSQWC